MAILIQIVLLCFLLTSAAFDIGSEKLVQQSQLQVSLSECFGKGTFQRWRACLDALRASSRSNSDNTALVPINGSSSSSSRTSSTMISEAVLQVRHVGRAVAAGYNHFKDHLKFFPSEDVLGYYGHQGNEKAVVALEHFHPRHPVSRLPEPPPIVISFDATDEEMKVLEEEALREVIDTVMDEQLNDDSHLVEDSSSYFVFWLCACGLGLIVPWKLFRRRTRLKPQTSDAMRSKKRKMKWGLMDGSDDGLVEEEEEDDDESEEDEMMVKRKKRKEDKGRQKITTEKCSMQEVLEDFFEQQGRVEKQWREAVEKKEEERRAREKEWSSYFKQLSTPLDFAIARMLHEALRERQTDSHNLSELIEFALKESFVPVLRNQCEDFADNVVRSFERVMGENSKCVEDAADFLDQAATESPNLEVPAESSNFKASECVDLLSSSASRMVSSAEVVMFNPASSAAMSEEQKSDMSLMQRAVDAQEHVNNQMKCANYLKLLKLMQNLRLNDLMEQQLILKQKENELKIESVVLRGESNVLMKEQTSVIKWAHEDKMTMRGESELGYRCRDNLMAGLLVNGGCMVFGIWNQKGVLFSRLSTRCSLPSAALEKRSGWFGGLRYMTWMTRMEELGSMGLCYIWGGVWIVIGLVGFAMITMTVMKSNVVCGSSRGMPMSVIMIGLGGICGWLGRQAVGMFGGDGERWLIWWEVFCIAHAACFCMLSRFYRLLDGGKKRVCRQLVFNMIMGFVLPLLVGLAPFPGAYVRLLALLSSYLYK